LDTTQPNPAKGQGGIGIMQPISFDLAQITSKVNGTRVDSNLPVSTLAKGSHMHVAYPIAFSVIDDGQDATNGLSPTLRVGGNAGDMMGVAFDTYNQTLSDVNQTIKSPVGGANESIGTVIAPALTTNNPSRSPQASEVTQQVNAVYQASMAVRRLTPIECERLQGFPDNYPTL
jgi:DNA (cytosine-5)-methyltransferase 1